MKNWQLLWFCVLAAMLFVAGCGSSNKSTEQGRKAPRSIASQGYAEVEIRLN